MANILKKIVKAVTPKKSKSKKKSSTNTGLSWKLDRLYASKEKHEKSYAPKRKRAARTRTKK
jgi:hypothetical protein